MLSKQIKLILSTIESKNEFQLRNPEIAFEKEIREGEEAKKY